MSITLLGGFNSATYNPFAGPTSTIEYLIVAGGGGGGDNYPGSTDIPGAGGAGGLLTASGLNITVGSSITITVGSGGTKSNGTDGTNGGDSSIVAGTTITASGGGYSKNMRAPGSSTPGNAGGCGGGGGGGSGAGGTGVAGQGYAGGASSGDTIGGGGGGAGSPGLTGIGGAGFVSSISGSPVQYSSGGKPYYQTQSSSGINGPSNTGNGGSGGPVNLQGGGGNGGSGIVIIRYPANFDPPASVVGTLQGVQGSIANGYRVYIWTSSGTITF